MNTKVLTALVAVALGIGGTLTFQVDAQSTFTADNVASTTPYDVIPVEISTPVTQTQRYTKNDVNSQIAAIDGRITELQAERVSWVALLAGIQTELDKLPARAPE